MASKRKSPRPKPKKHPRTKKTHKTTPKNDIAQTFGLSRGTVTKYWGGRRDTVSLSALQKQFEECFYWAKCPNSHVMFWAPKFLPSFECPGCGDFHRWRESWFKEMAKD